MTRTGLALAIATMVLAAPALAQISTGGTGDTGRSPPPRQGGAITREEPGGGLGAGTTSGAPVGNEASPSNSSVLGTTPGVNIGGSPTSGPPGSGGPAGGIGGVNR